MFQIYLSLHEMTIKVLNEVFFKEISRLFNSYDMKLVKQYENSDGKILPLKNNRLTDYQYYNIDLVKTNKLVPKNMSWRSIKTNRDLLTITNKPIYYNITKRYNDLKWAAKVNRVALHFDEKNDTFTVILLIRSKALDFYLKQIKKYFNDDQLYDNIFGSKSELINNQIGIYLIYKVINNSNSKDKIKDKVKLFMDLFGIKLQELIGTTIYIKNEMIQKNKDILI